MRNEDHDRDLAAHRPVGVPGRWCRRSPRRHLIVLVTWAGVATLVMACRPVIVTSGPRKPWR